MNIRGTLDLVGRTLLVLSSLTTLYTAGFGLFSATTQRGLHWLFLSVSLFLLYKPQQSDNHTKNKFSYLLNTLCLIAALSSSLYLLLNWEDRVLKVGTSPFMDTIMAVLMIIVVLEATRRTTGLVLTITTGVFLLYALLGPYFPAPLGHRGQSIERLSNFLYFTTEGIYGVPMGISATFIILFVIFGAFLEKFGVGQWFIDISYALTGRYRGGPAKTAIFSSGLMGMISGSPVANVATTGTFTIPLMKLIGYKPHQAGAIEAVASTGGMFTPPIMGAGAFIMAEYLGIPYSEVALSATLPAVLFYFSVLISIDSQAVKQGIVGIEQAKLPSAWRLIREKGHLCIPLVFLVTMILVGWSPMKSAFWSTILTLGIAFFRLETRPDLKKLLLALENGSKDVISIAAACASAGIIVGVISITGLGAKLSYILIELSHGSIVIALILSMIIAIILGCGMPPTAVYIILVSILVPPLTELGIAPLGAHMFLFFFSSIAALTPPVAITAYAAAAIAKASPNKTGFASFRLGLIAYIIPFMFVFSPSLLLQGSMGEIIQSTITAVIGVLCLVGAIEGYFLIHWGRVSRIILFFTALLFLDSGLITDLIGVSCVIISFLIEKYKMARLNLNKVIPNEEKVI